VLQSPWRPVPLIAQRDAMHPVLNAGGVFSGGGCLSAAGVVWIK
jgi:hypothetical protein